MDHCCHCEPDEPAQSAEKDANEIKRIIGIVLRYTGSITMKYPRAVVTLNSAFCYEVLNYARLVIDKYEGMEEECSYKLRPLQ